jgi:hypothetical protein
MLPHGDGKVPGGPYAGDIDIQGGEKGPDARQRPSADPEAYPWYVEGAAERR